MGSLFLLNVILARSIPKADYAAYLSAYAVVPFLAVLATLGVPFALMRSVRGDASHPTAKAASLRGALSLTIIGSILSGILCYAASAVAPVDAKWVVLRHYPSWMAAWVAASALCMVTAIFLQAEEDFRTAALIGPP
jgi:O-antigen/teichoic acid export membrane protein